MDLSDELNCLVSITVPVYNTEKKLVEECINSILNQTYKNIELILVDDGSSKECADFLDTFAKKDNRVSIIHQKNSGQSSARNSGLSVAKGDYICFVDSDDMIEPMMIEKSIVEANRTNADIIGWTYKRLYGKKNCAGEYKGPDVLTFEKENINDFLRLCLCSRSLENIYYPYCVCLWGKLFRMKLFLDNPEIRLRTDMKFAEDQDIVQRLYPMANRIVIFHEDLYIYRLNEHSLTKRLHEDFLAEQMKAFDILSEDIGSDNAQLKETFANYRVGFLVKYGTSFLYHPDLELTYREKRNLIKNTVKLNHFHNTLNQMNCKYFTKGQYFYLLCLKWKLYDIALLTVWYGTRNKKHY